MYSIQLLKAIAAEVDTDRLYASSSFEWDHELRVVSHSAGVQVEVLHGWMEPTGMGAEYETRSLFKGPNKLTFTFLCELVQL